MNNDSLVNPFIYELAALGDDHNGQTLSGTREEISAQLRTAFTASKRRSEDYKKELDELYVE